MTKLVRRDPASPVCAMRAEHGAHARVECSTATADSGAEDLARLGTGAVADLAF